MSINTTSNLAFLGMDDSGAARAFYGETLGLRFVADEQGTLVFDMGGTPLRISQVEDFKPQPFTVLGWLVADIEAEIDKLIAAVAEPLRYPGMPQDDKGIADLDGVRILWFNDPAGNNLSLTQG